MRIFGATLLALLAVACGGPSPSTSHLQANEKGNGGDAVVCFTSRAARDRAQTVVHAGGDPFETAANLAAIRSLMMLDLFEFSRPTGFPPQIPELREVPVPFNAQIAPVIARLKLKSSLGDALEAALRDIPLDTWRAAANGVVEIDDSDQASLVPADCLLIQIAVRHGNVVTYDQRLFERFDEVNRLALILHELTYKVAADLGEDNSRAARRAVGLALSKTVFDDLDPYDVHRRLAPLDSGGGFRVDVEGQPIWVWRVGDKESVDGQPLELLVKQATSFTHGAWTYQLNAAPRPGDNEHYVTFNFTQEPLSFMADTGKAVDVDTSFTAPKTTVKPASADEIKLDFYYSDGAMHANSLDFKNVRGARIVGGSLVEINLPSSARSVPIATNGGMLNGGDTIEFDPVTHLPTSVGRAEGSISLGGLTLNAIAAMLDGHGHLVSVYTSGYTYDDYCATCTLTFAGLAMRWTHGMTAEFGAEGTPHAFAFIGGRNSAFTWEKGSFSCVERLELDESLRLSRVKLCDMGHLVHHDQYPQGIDVGAVTVAVDAAGQVRIPE